MSKTEQEGKLLQRRRLRAGRLLLKSVAQAEVARRVGVTRTTVSEWNEKLEDGGARGAEAPATGSTGWARFHAAPRTDPAAEARRTGRRIWHRVVDTAAGGPAHRATLCSPLQREPSVADSHVAGLQLLAPFRAGARARRVGDPAVETAALAGSKKNALKQARTIVFMDESGLSEQPTRVRTWAPRGETPVLQYHFNWHPLSVIAAITFWRFYFRLFAGSIKAPQIIEFLNALGHQIRRPLLVIWDGLPGHRSTLVREYLESLNGAVQIEQLPAYAPD